MTSHPRHFYEQQAKAILQNLRVDKELTHTELARRLEAHGVRLEPQALINKLNRGTYSFTFALQVLAAMGVKVIHVPQLPARTKGRPKRHEVPTLDPDE